MSILFRSIEVNTGRIRENCLKWLLPGMVLGDKKRVRQKSMVLAFVYFAINLPELFTFKAMCMCYFDKK